MHYKQNLPKIAKSGSPIRNELSRRDLLARGATAATAFIVTPTSQTQAQSLQPHFKPIPIQYIAALGDTQARSGNNAHTWGLWRRDPGPRGVALANYDRLQSNGGIAPAKWHFDTQDWWLEEHGLMMEAPEFPLPPGFYKVTGGREIAAVLTVHVKAKDGTQHWQLDNNATIYDVTHLRCRSGRYRPTTSDSFCSPSSAKQSDFPVEPGAEMPVVDGCDKQDYSVFIVTEVAEL